MADLKPCPFCGKAMDAEDPDTLHPNGIGWLDIAGLGRSYVNFREAPREQWCHLVRCCTTAGGCGSEMHADSAADAIEAWNRRANPQPAGWQPIESAPKDGTEVALWLVPCPECEAALGKKLKPILSTRAYFNGSAGSGWTGDRSYNNRFRNHIAVFYQSLPAAPTKD